MESAYGVNDDYLDDDDDGIMYSTRAHCSDSDGENDTFRSMCQKLKEKDCKKNETTEEQDPFEEEMAAELAATMQKLVSAKDEKANVDPKKEESSKDEESPFYDNIYFDSDKSDSDEDFPEVSVPLSATSSTKTSRRSRARRRVIPDDELLYDPQMDDDDQEWVDRNLRPQYATNNKDDLKGGFKPKKMPESDAVLNCPACFTTICLDCQRHEIYSNQYRAMFVFNCRVDYGEVLQFSVKESKKSKFKRKKKAEMGSQSNETPLSELAASATSTLVKESDEKCVLKDDDSFHPVMCSTCNTKVAVYDRDEVYHFFNSITSH